MSLEIGEGGLPPFDADQFERRLTDRLNNLRELVAQLTTSKTSEVEDGIRNGYKKLFEGAFGIKLANLQRKVVCHLDSEELCHAQEVMSEIFLLCTYEYPKKIIKHDPDKVYYEGGIVNPIYAETIIERHGLIDGRIKSLKEAADIMGITEHAARRFTNGAFKCLRADINTQKLVPSVIEFQDTPYF